MEQTQISSWCWTETGTLDDALQLVQLAATTDLTKCPLTLEGQQMTNGYRPTIPKVPPFGLGLG